MEYDAHKLSEKVDNEKLDGKKYPWEPDENEFDDFDEDDEIDWKTILLFRHSSKARRIVNGLDIIFCLISGYIYMWLSRFGNEVTNEGFWSMMDLIEIYFVFSMYTNFMTEYVIEG